MVVFAPGGKHAYDVALCLQAVTPNVNTLSRAVRRIWCESASQQSAGGSQDEGSPEDGDSLFDVADE
jgi:hypothetical protein